MAGSRTWTAAELERALEGKGFHRTDSTHRKLSLTVENSATHIFIPISHSRNTEYAFGKGGLLNRVKDEAGLRTNSELRRLLECPMDFDEYVSLLRQRGIIE